MKADTLLAALPDLSARLMRDALAGELHIGWDAFCAHNRLKVLRFDGETREVLAREELDLQHAFAGTTPDRATLWIELGFRYRAMKYGGFGLAMMTARTLGEALAIACRYQELSFSLIAYRLERRGDGGLSLVGNAEAVPANMRRFSQYRDLGAIRTLLCDLTGGAPPLEFVAVAAPRPEGWDAARARFCCPVIFDADRIEWRLRPASDVFALPLADRDLALLYGTKCEGLLKNARAAAPVSHRLSAMFEVTMDRFPCAAQAADRLALSERTLHRRLAEEGTRFSALLDEARFRRARAMLADRALSVEAISDAMGFAEPSSFSRAFKRWSGMGTGEYRRRLDALPGS